MLTLSAKWWLNRKCPKDPAGRIDFALSSFVEARDSLKTTIDDIVSEQESDAAELEVERQRLQALEISTKNAYDMLEGEHTRAGKAVSKLEEILGD